MHLDQTVDLAQRAAWEVKAQPPRKVVRGPAVWPGLHLRPGRSAGKEEGGRQGLIRVVFGEEERRRGDFYSPFGGSGAYWIRRDR
jgi:hypothetical protein